MNVLRQLLILAVLGIGSAIAFAADGGAPRLQRYALAQHGYLELLVPSGWRAKVSQPRKQEPPVISFSARTGKSFIATVAPIWKTVEPNVPTDKEALRKRVENDADGIRLFAVEKQIKLTEIAGTSGAGFYFFATDAAPGGGYRYMTKGQLFVGELTVMFTILTNAGQESVAREGLAMLQSARHSGAPR